MFTREMVLGSSPIELVWEDADRLFFRGKSFKQAVGLFGSMELAQMHCVYECKSERGPSPNDLRICYDINIAAKILCKYSGVFNSVF